MDLHVECGIGPSELSLTNPKAISVVYSPQSGTLKGPSYDVTQPYVSLEMIRNGPDHTKRRKVWDRGFSSKGSSIMCGQWVLRWS